MTDTSGMKLLFTCDRMLGTLARWMRLLGFDVEYPGEMPDTQLLELAISQERLLLTRDFELAGRSDKCFLIHELEVEEQLEEVVQGLVLPVDPKQALTRCSLCNSLLEKATRDDVRGLVPDRIHATHNTFMVCPGCNKAYWQGSHWDKILSRAIEIGAGVEAVKPTLLLHVCCAPCSTAVVEMLMKEYEVIPFFFNPNIQPEAEYEKRKREFITLMDKLGLESIIGNYDEEAWKEAVIGLEKEPEGGARCTECFKLRLNETARRATSFDAEIIASTLSISPHKNADVINRVGMEAAQKHGIEFLPRNFKKGGGFERSLELSREHELCRQDYCGCLFSKKERQH